MSQSFRPISPLSEKDKQRFFAKVKHDDSGCHLWTASTFYHGYGKFRLKDKIMLPHRVAFAIYYEQDPGESLVMHSCDNPICVNPEHLSLGSNQDNMDDMVRKKRHPHGESFHSAKLKEEDVIQIRAATLVHGSLAALARIFSVDPTTIKAVISRESWKHIA